MKSLEDLINRTSIRSQLFATVATGIIFLLVALIFASTWVSDQQVRQVLIEQGKQAASNLSKNSSLALLYDSPDNAETAIQSALAFPGVEHVNIYKADESLFYCSKMKNMSGMMPTDDSNINNNTSMTGERLNLRSIKSPLEVQIIKEDNDSWQFFAPVSIKAPDQTMQDQIFSSSPDKEQQVIGYVIITKNKNSLNIISRGILLSNGLIAVIIGLLLLLALQKTIKRLTQPLFSISAVMQKAEKGEHISHVSTDGPLEIHHIAGAFNNMIGALAERDEELRKQNIHLEKQAKHDHLTGLINRIGFEQSLKQSMEECSATQIKHALCYMDLDKFKIVNDSCGHNAGDELLKNISGIFKHHIRKSSDVLARVGGDEFALILKNCTLEKARSICENICRDINNYRFTWDDKIFSIGVSIGIIELNENSVSVKDVVSMVDSACYTAKEQGRGQVFVIEDGDENIEMISANTLIANQIIAHIENNKFDLLCQKIQPLNKDIRNIHHYEITLQMMDRDNQPVPHHKFLSAAERYGLMHRVDLWLIENTLKRLHTHKDTISALDIWTINISSNSLNDQQLMMFIKQQLTSLNIKPSNICFAITETTAINNIDKASQFINSIHQLGCTVALDDFVSNASSFSYIKKMNIDYLKIHGDFFKDFASNPVNQVMAKSIHEIAHILNIRTIAEHINDKQSLKTLLDIGIDYAQGNAITPPVLFDDYLTTIKPS